ncbi:MAG: hypothetical protein QOF33_3380 [Thermomicrobiales bacterium]|jgi:Flp pilus assembly pilin Flp|nr:hypothetical protein [Thermomicrobiales bacterium]MEA2585295.1 hypothetical protein [Thermomicrobiales bacterium]
MDIRSSVTRAIPRLFGSEEVEGQSMVEYSLIFVLMIIVCFAVLASLSDQINEQFFKIVQAMP